MLTVSFIGKTSAGSLDPAFSIWSYKVQSDQPGSSGAGELSAGVKIALGFPGSVDVRGSERYPNLPQLVGITVQRDAGTGRQYVVRQIDTPGTQTLSFVALTGEALRDVQLANAPPKGRRWLLSRSWCQEPPRPRPPRC